MKERNKNIGVQKGGVESSKKGKGEKKEGSVNCFGVLSKD